jgi:hypothetical protein
MLNDITRRRIAPSAARGRAVAPGTAVQATAIASESTAAAAAAAKRLRRPLLIRHSTLSAA